MRLGTEEDRRGPRALAGVLLLAVTACSNERSADIDVSDAQIPAYRIELLDLAFEAVSAMPKNPHIKDRSKLQGDVVTVTLELKQPERALAYIDRIDNWRRGRGYAEYAHYCATAGDKATAERYLGLAMQVADGKYSKPGFKAWDNFQAWRRDHIRAKVAEVRLLLGDDAGAESAATDLEPAEASKLRVASSQEIEPAQFDAVLEGLDQTFKNADFEQSKVAMATCVRLFRQFYGDARRRGAVEERVRTSYDRFPLELRMESMLQLIAVALDKKDKPKALSLVETAQEMLGRGRWTPEVHVGLKARLAGLRHGAGDEQRAREELRHAITLFEAGKGEIMSMWRAGALRPIAESYRSMGDTNAALVTYKRCVEEGAVNPNARPRAEDLAANCLSMATSGVEPDAALRERLHQIRKGLVEPW